MSKLPEPSLWKDRKVLVTGHTGFKGTWLCHWLENLGARVCGYALEPDGEPSLCRATGLQDRIASELADVRDASRLAAVFEEFRPEVVLHLAAQSLVRHSYRDPLETYATNVLGTANVLEACRHTSSVHAVLVVTTDKCYENREWLWGYRESDRLGGHDPYSSSKACAELVADAYRRSFFDARGVLLATARAGNVIGGGDYAADRLVADAMRAFQQDRTLELRSPGATRPWQHVLDPLCGYLLLAEKLLERERAFAEPFNFGPAEEHQVGTVAALLAGGWGPEAKVVARAGEEHPHEAGRLHLDSSKACYRLGWQLRLDLQAAVEWTVQFYRAWHDGGDPRRLIEADLERYRSLVKE